MADKDPNAEADRVKRHIMASPHTAALGVEVIGTSKGRGRLRVPWRAELVADPETEVIASGVVTVLIDHACGMACAMAGDPPQTNATLDLRIDYMRPARPRHAITAEAVCYRLTRSVGFVRAQAWDVDESDPVATAQAAFMLNPRG